MRSKLTKSPTQLPDNSANLLGAEDGDHPVHRKTLLGNTSQPCERRTQSLTGGSLAEVVAENRGSMLLLLLLLLLLLHDLYRANFENRVKGAGFARWRT